MLVVEGILAIQSGDNPRVVAEKLISFVPPAERETEDEDSGPALHAVDGGAEAEAAHERATAAAAGAGAPRRSSTPTSAGC